MRQYHPPLDGVEKSTDDLGSLSNDEFFDLIDQELGGNDLTQAGGEGRGRGL